MIDKKITLRPSSLPTFISCPYQWYNVFILGKTTITNSRAAIGTAVHKGAELLWSEAIETGKIDDNISKLTDAAMEAYKEEEERAEDRGGIQYGEGEDRIAAELDIIKGTNAFVEDIVPFTDIPDGVEKRLSIAIDNPIIKEVAGTIDYIQGDTIADIKTSKRKIIPASYTLQQSTYKLIAKDNGINVSRNLIQGVVFNKTKTVGTILEMDAHEEQAKYIINSLLDTVGVLAEDKIDPKVLFRGNPKHYLCSHKYCSLHSTCPFVNG